MTIEIQYTDLRSLETQSAQDPILISQDDWFKYNSRSNIDNGQMQPTSLPSIGPSASPYPTAESTTLMQPISLPSIQPSASPYPTAESAALMQPISLPLIQPSTSPYLQPARKHKHGEWNLHYEKNLASKEIVECTCIQRQCFVKLWYKTIPGYVEIFGTEFKSWRRKNEYSVIFRTW